MKYRLMIFLCMFSLLKLTAQEQKQKDSTANAASVYSLKLDSITGKNQIDFSKFQNKKILIVNIASVDGNTSQITELEQLGQHYKKRLAIIVCPSNDFNSEPRNNKQIADFLRKPNSVLIVAEKTTTRNDSIPQVYQWLTQKTSNGLKDAPVAATFQKYLIDEKGKLIDVFAAKTRPMSKEIRNAIEKN